MSETPHLSEIVINPNMTHNAFKAWLRKHRESLLHKSRVMKGVCRVELNDNLHKIAEAWLRYDKAWPVIALVNDLQDPDHIEVGERLLIPTKKEAARIMERIKLMLDSGLYEGGDNVFPLR